MGANEVSTASICIVVLLCRTCRGNLRITIFGDSEDFPLCLVFKELRCLFPLALLLLPGR